MDPTILLRTGIQSVLTIRESRTLPDSLEPAPTPPLSRTGVLRTPHVVEGRICTDRPPVFSETFVRLRSTYEASQVKRSAPAVRLLRSPSHMVTVVCSGGGRRGGRQEYPEVRSYVESERVGHFDRGISCWRRDSTRIEFRKPCECPLHHSEPQDVRLHSGPFDSVPCSYLQNTSSYWPHRFPSRASPFFNGPDVASCESIRGQSVYGGTNGGICIPN